MSKKILIVESDAQAVDQMRSALQAKGFEVEDTADAKGCLELARSQTPELVILAVDLPQGQNGYILCGKFKKDDDLKAIPVVVVGSPEGFAAHKKLKTRADDYVAQPVEDEALVASVGALIGFPEGGSGEEDLSLSELVDDEEPVSLNSEEPSLEGASEPTVSGDPELDMLDAAFDNISSDGDASSGDGLDEPISSDDAAAGDDEPMSLDEPAPEGESELDALTEDPAPSESAGADLSLEDPAGELTNLDEAGGELSALEESPALASLDEPASTPEEDDALGALGDLGEAEEKTSHGEAPAEEELALGDPLEEPASALTSSGEDSSGEQEELRRQLEEAQARIRELEAKGGKADSAATREATAKKDKELGKLKNELSAKDQELATLKEREGQLEQQFADAQSDVARKDALLKTANSKVEQLLQDKRRFDQQLAAAKEEALNATSELSTAQSELDELRAKVQEAESASGQLEDIKRQMEQLQSELDEKNTELSSQSTSFAEETEKLRQRISELEESTHKHEERLAKLYARIRSDEKIREKMKKALGIASQLLDEQQAGIDDEDESAAA